MNREMIQKGVKLILEGIGEDITREGLWRPGPHCKNV